MEKVMQVPKKPISPEAYQHLKQEIKRMKNIERKKTEKRLEMYDRGYRKHKEEE
jgi:hypothetical protein